MHYSHRHHPQEKNGPFADVCKAKPDPALCCPSSCALEAEVDRLHYFFGSPFEAEPSQVAEWLLLPCSFAFVYYAEVDSDLMNCNLSI